MSRTVKALITEQELADKIDTALTALGGSYYEYKNLTPRVAQDLSKVSFDLENVCVSREEAFRGFDNLVGLHTLPSGLAYLGLGAGGDWEIPIFFIIYWDGKELRGYIPKDGNPWNTDTKAAYGNDADADVANAKKLYGIVMKEPDDVPDVDEAKILADIESRIKVTGPTTRSAGHSLQKEKRQLYLALIKEHPDQLSDNEVSIMELLAKDPDIQSALKP
jgi:hypothetical protein